MKVMHDPLKHDAAGLVWTPEGLELRGSFLFCPDGNFLKLVV